MQQLLPNGHLKAAQQRSTGRLRANKEPSCSFGQLHLDTPATPFQTANHRISANASCRARWPASMASSRLPALIVQVPASNTVSSQRCTQPRSCCNCTIDRIIVFVLSMLTTTDYCALLNALHSLPSAVCTLCSLHHHAAARLTQPCIVSDSPSAPEHQRPVCELVLAQRTRAWLKSGAQR
ncbi:hypothetical protein PMIN02_001998 [Paraphaeosphaeria minitans]